MTSYFFINNLPADTNNKEIEQALKDNNIDYTLFELDTEKQRVKVLYSSNSSSMERIESLEHVKFRDEYF